MTDLAELQRRADMAAAEVAIEATRLREAREALWAGNSDRATFEGVVSRYDAARAIVASVNADLIAARGSHD